MAGAATLSPLINITHLHSSLSPAAKFSFPHHHYTHRRKPIISICQSQLNTSIGEEAEEIDGAFFEGDDVVEDESDEEDTESSVDLLIRFLQSMLKKVSKRAKRASRSVLPSAIPPQLVSFAVDGILLLAALSILKALLEVICTLGGSVFVVILLLRVIWAAVSYFQSSGSGFNQGGSSFGTTQPVA
ncbi:protein SHORT HYPOCOTYL IN WHITE LIGHT 1 isoform X2 [Corylus avellana]|uniref:protein SHORT HYPOCOTYL IN WHITE LIGHT 1 isoform X2 n=1 Tax=Corylus avellana TaxID=13451 RepID=UPI00286BBE56|nr:protein SHORT HYPOCOTYL IN WHITE LIGHT 1 isoform X2 [Corylus avellana]